MDYEYYILFDYDGVLVNQVDFAGLVSRKYGLNERRLRLFFKDHLVECLKGENDLVKLLSEILDEIGWQESALKLFNAIYIESQNFNKALIGFIKTDLSPNHKCYIATNQDANRYEFIRKSQIAKNIFQFVFSSSELGINKPNISYFEKIYSKLLEQKEDLEKGQIIFIDDIIENVVSAELFGITVHLYENLKAFKLFINNQLSGQIFPIINVDDIQLSKMMLSHAKHYSEILSEPDTYKFLTESGPVDEKKACLKIISNRKSIEAGKSLYWSIIGRSEEFIGFIAIHSYNETKVFISFGIHPLYRRRGIASKTLKRVLNWEHLENKSIVMATHIENIASFRMLSKLDLVYKGIIETKQGERHVFEK